MVVPSARDVLIEAAADQYGYVTVDDAARYGINSHAISELMKREAVEQVSRGIYRMSVLPYVPDGDLYLAVLLTGRKGVIGGESAIALHELADALPSRIRVAVPPGFKTTRQVPGPRISFEPWPFTRDDTTEVRNIPVADVPMAVLMAIKEGIDPSLIDQAIINAERRQLIGRRTAARLTVALDDFERGLA